MNKTFFCSTAHRDADLRERKNYRASKDCRLCGRPAKNSVGSKQQAAAGRTKTAV
jgi:hypothetical protein